MAIKWSTPPDVITKNIEVWGETTKKNIVRVADGIAKDGMAYMQTARPWTDRTGEAKRRLQTNVETTPANVTVYFVHGVEYGVYLELKNGGAYEIVTPAVQKFSNETMSRLGGAGG